LEVVLPLRMDLLRDGVRDEARLPDDLPDALHLGGWLDDPGTDQRVDEEAPDGCASWYPSQGWRLRGMAVRPWARRRGLGSALLDVGVAAAAAAGQRTVWCNARTTALPFYEHHGWVPVSAVFDTERGPHVRMERAT
jgi:GNAT superfamily N-acetyltransferase